MYTFYNLNYDIICRISSENFIFIRFTQSSIFNYSLKQSKYFHVRTKRFGVRGIGKCEFIVFVKQLKLMKYQQKLKMKDFLVEGEPLMSFRQQNSQQLFTVADSFPDFFRSHLLDPCRVIKVFLNDPNANERVFYYQYLKICQDYENGSSQERIENMKQFILNDELKILFPEQETKTFFSDGQFKRIVFQFMNIINEGELGVDEALKQYPIVDIVFVYLMRTLLIYNNKAQTFSQYIDRNETFAYLSSIFDIQLELFDNCIKFSDADIFVYQEIPSEVYMAYILGEENGNAEEANNSGILQIPNHKTNNQMYISSNSSVYEFVDFTTNSNNTNALEEKEGLQPRLSSTMKISCQAVNKIAQMKEEEGKDEDEQENDEISDDLEMQFENPNQIIKPLPELKDSKEGNYEKKGIENISEEIQMIQKMQKNKEKQEQMKIGQERRVDEMEKETNQIVQKNSAYENKNQKRRQNEIQIQERISNQYEEVPVYDRDVIVPKDSFNQGTKEQRTMDFIWEMGQKRFSFQHKSALSYYFKEERSQEEKVKEGNKLRKSNKPRLNVSSEFTNSFLLNKVSQPYKTRIRETKERARLYRKSLNKPLI